jgi:thymidylate synthase (FAD)
MNIIEQFAHIVDPVEGDILRQIESRGRVCYKSEDKITPESATGFVKRAIESGHNTVLEMAVLHLVVEFDGDLGFDNFIGGSRSPYLHISRITDTHPRVKDNALLTGNVRAFREMDGGSSDEAYVILGFLSKQHPALFRDVYEKTEVPLFFHSYCSGVEGIRFATPEELMGKPKHTHVCVRFVTSRDVTHQLVRYRRASPLQESQRYCNYTANRFGNSVTFIRPCWYVEGSEEYKLWAQQCSDAEKMYFRLAELGSSEKARTVLPNSTKSELLIYADLEEWQHIFNQRVSPHAYAPTRELLAPLYEEFKVKYKGLIV